MNPADRRMYTAAPDFFTYPYGEEACLVDDAAADDYSSGASTPPLWWPASPPPPPQNNYRSLSPASIAQAIARGQKELMEMVSRMPEGCYELSLKDLVEHHHGIEPPLSTTESKLIDGRGGGKVRWAMTNNPVATGARISRSGSLDHGGFLLKMGLPVSSLRSRNNSKNTTIKAEKKTTGRVAPTGKAGAAAEKEWWKDEKGSSAGFSSNSGSGDSKSSSHSRSSSSRSSSRNSNSTRGRSGGCCLFFWSTKAKVAE